MEHKHHPADPPSEIAVEQAGVIPYRWHEGHIEVLLITSRTRGRWIVPKGNIEPHLNPLESARVEAYEEAGVRGRIGKPPLGTYLHGDPPRQEVLVYLMEVEEELADWPEREERQRQWLPLTEAQAQVDEDGVRPLLDVAAKILQ